MSFRVVTEVLERSRVEDSTNLSVLLAIAETAHHDGIAFLPQGPVDDSKSIAFRSRNSLRTVERSVADLEWNLEVEIRKAQRGRARINVYRVLSGSILYVQPDYERLPFVLREPFSSPEEILALRTARQLDGWSERPQPASLAGGQSGDDPPSEDGLAANGGGSGTGPQNQPWTSETSKDEVSEVGAGAPAGKGEQVKELVRAFAGVFGRWPDGRDEWGTWCAAFAPLVDQGVSPEQLALAANRYRQHFAPRWKDSPELELSAFGLTKHWQVISASLQLGYFAMYRWATETAWRLDDLDECRWIIENAAGISDEERAQLHATVAQSYRAHLDPESALLQWVETKGWAVEDDEWGAEVSARLNGVRPTSVPDLRRRALERRVELRRGLAELGIRKSA